MLLKLSPRRRKTKGKAGQEAPLPTGDSATGEVDPDFDDEDTEKEIEELLAEVETLIADLPPDSPEVSHFAKTLLKVCGFIAKVHFVLNMFAQSTYLGYCTRFGVRLKQRSTLGSAVPMQR